MRFLSYEKNRTNLEFAIWTMPEDHLIDLLLYYVGYKVEGEGCDEIELIRGLNNVIRMVVADMEEVSSSRIWFETPPKWTIASWISTSCLAFLLYLLFCRKTSSASVPG